MTHLLTPVAALTISVVAAVFCFASLTFGWFGGNEFFVRGHGNFAAMVPTTQISFMALMSALILIVRDTVRGHRIAAKLCTGVLVVVGVNVALRLTLTDQGIDAFLPFPIAEADHMSYATAGLLALAAILTKRTALTWPRQPIMLLGGSLMGLTTVGSIAMSHSLDVNGPYVLRFAHGMSLYTMLLLSGLFLALLLIHSRPLPSQIVDAD